MFDQVLSDFPIREIIRRIHAVEENEVKQILMKSKWNFDDLCLLLSPPAGRFLEEMERASETVRRRRFGNIVQLYIPLYLSSKCENACLYCGFRKSNKSERKTLSLTEVFQEADHIYQMGFRNLLLVSGETKDLFKDEYLPRILRKLSGKFASIAIEVQPLDLEGYSELRQNNLDGVTLYQETYDPNVYSQVHPSGGKSDFSWRLNSMDRAGSANIRRLGIGALLGLADWRTEAICLGLHCRYLLRKYWKSSVALSVPRICENEGGFRAAHPVSDPELAQMIFAFRMVFPDNDLVLSTRESPALRDHMAGAAVTYISAGSRTNPGGYTLNSLSGRQFEMADNRPVEEICGAMKSRGLDVVWKDWNDPESNNLETIP